MSTVKEVTILTPRNRLEAESVLGEYTTLVIEHQRQANELNGELASVREKFEGKLDKLATQIKSRGDALQAWADAYPVEFGKAKSIEMIHGTIGWRMGTGKLKTRSRKTWAAVLETLRLMGLGKFIRTTEEVAKDQIISAIHANEIDFDTAKRIGVQVVKEDVFFVEPKLEGEVAK